MDYESAKAKAKAEEAQEQAEIDRVLGLLAERGVRLYAGGCGCCGSPWVQIWIDGEKVMDTEARSIGERAP